MHARCAATFPRRIKKRPATRSTKLVALSTAFRWGSIESFINAASAGSAPALCFPVSFYYLTPLVGERIKIVAALFEQAALDQIFDGVENRESSVGIISSRLE